MDNFAFYDPWFSEEVSGKRFDNTPPFPVVSLVPLKLKGFPNPKKDVANISFINRIIKNENLRLSIYDVNGQLVFNQNIPSNQYFISIDLSDFEEGMYVINMYNDKEVLGSSKLIVTK